MVSVIQIKPTDAADTIIVPDDYPTIQSAINAANPADRIYVRTGVYYENIEINKTVSLIGENKNSTIIDGNQNIAIYVKKANNVNFTGFTVRTVESALKHPPTVELSRASNCYILENTIENIGGIGVYLYYSSNNKVSLNTINFVSVGITLDESSNNRITNNTVVASTEGIVVLFNSNNNMLSANEIKGGDDGIRIAWGTYNTIYSNTIENNGQGIELQSATYNRLLCNLIRNNVEGIRLQMASPGFPSHSNVIYSNEVVSNNNYGIVSIDSLNNSIFHNNFEANRFQAYNIHSEEFGNVWDGGYPSGGNYWSDHEFVDEFSGPNQDELGSDGICDTHYVINEDNQDNYPLMNPLSLDYSIPALVSVNYPDSIEPEEWATITITATNDGDTADWQTIHIGFPDNPPVENIEIVSHDMNGGAEIYPLGSSLWAGYSEYNITSTYVVVEGIHKPWETGETHTMTVRVKPENIGTFTFYVKTVSRAGGITYYDPTDTMDQQDEYVYVYEINVQTAENLVEKYFPYFIFDEQEKYYPTDFYHDDTDITNNLNNYDEAWPLTAYAHTVEYGDNKDYLCIQYWFYYANDLGKVVIPDTPWTDEITFYPHPHDWESVYVFFEKQDADYIPKCIGYFHHAEIWVDLYSQEIALEDCYNVMYWQNPLWEPEKIGTHPVVHVARHSHASYPHTVFDYAMHWTVIGVEPGHDIVKKIPLPIEPCDGGLQRSYNEFQIIYVDEPDVTWPDQFGDIAAPWNRTRWNTPEDILLPPHIIKNSFTMLSLNEPGSKLYLHVYDNESRHVGFNKETSEVETEIPESYYEDLGNTTFIILPENTTDFKVTVDGKHAHKPVETYELVVSTVKDDEVVDKTITGTIEQGKSQDFSVKVSSSGEITIEEIPVEEPDFNISVSPTSKTLKQGESYSFTITIESLQDFDSTVDLDITGLPEGMGYEFIPSEVTPSVGSSVDSTLKVTVGSDVNPDNYTLMITGKSDSLTHTTTLTITVQTTEDGPKDKLEDNTLLYIIAVIGVAAVVAVVLLYIWRRRKKPE